MEVQSGSPSMPLDHPLDTPGAVLALAGGKHGTALCIEKFLQALPKTESQQ